MNLSDDIMIVKAKQTVSKNVGGRSVLVFSNIAHPTDQLLKRNSSYLKSNTTPRAPKRQKTVRWKDHSGKRLERVIHLEPERYIPYEIVAVKRDKGCICM